jgi:hypothetical protein
LSEEFFSKVRIDIDDQKRVLSTFATRTDVSQNDKAILLKAEYYLLRLSRVLYVKKIDSVLFRIRESQNAFPELHGKTMSLPLRDHYQGIIRLLATIQSELVYISVDKKAEYVMRSHTAKPMTTEKANSDQRVTVDKESISRNDIQGSEEDHSHKQQSRATTNNSIF